MSGQRPHHVYYNRKDFTLSNWRGEGLFNPRDYGLELQPWDTACVSGFVAEYVVWRNQLILASVRAPVPLAGIGVGGDEGMALGFSEEGEPCPLGEDWNPDEFRLPFSGAMLIGHGFLPEFYQHSGFQGAYAHEEVFELSFERGHLVEQIDRSDEMAGIRREIKAGSGDGDFVAVGWLSEQANNSE